VQLAGELPESVAVEWLGRTANDHRVDSADDGFVALFRFPSGLRAQVEVNRRAPVTLQTGWILVGDIGSYVAGARYCVTDDGEIVDIPLPRYAGNADELYTAVMSHIRHGAPNPVPVEQARQTIAVIETAFRNAN
jgi:predicted dehydrogenase